MGQLTLNGIQTNAVKHHARRHAARWTSEYLYCQLIPYIGNKRKLLPLIQQAIGATRALHNPQPVFLDAFAGSGVVSRLAKAMGFRVISNDWEPYAYEINSAFVGCNEPPEFARLGGMEAAFAMLNSLPPVEGYFATNMCPADDGNPDPEHERMFFTHRNGSKTDAVREGMEKWDREGLISRMEKSVLLASLIYSVSYVSNTSGVFKGFHRGWGGASGTALYRILSDIRLSPPEFLDNGQENETLREDANELVKRVGADIIYLDPPYNQHQYGSNYHILNTVALCDKPAVNPTILVNGRKTDKSAIRRDWRTERRSAYCYKQTASAAFEQLVSDCRSRWVLVSYSTDGIIPLDELVAILGKFGGTSSVSRCYKRYRVSPTRPSAEGYNREFVLILDKQGKIRGMRGS